MTCRPGNNRGVHPSLARMFHRGVFLCHHHPCIVHSPAAFVLAVRAGANELPVSHSETCSYACPVRSLRSRGGKCKHRNSNFHYPKEARLLCESVLTVAVEQGTSQPGRIKS